MIVEMQIKFNYPKHSNFLLPKSNETPDDSQTRAHIIKPNYLWSMWRRKDSEREKTASLINKFSYWAPANLPFDPEPGEEMVP